MTPEELHNIYKSESEFWWYRGMRSITAALLDSLRDSMPAGRAAAGLDAGCGTGFNALALEGSRGLRMFGVDLAPLGIAYCRERGFERSAVASITQLPFASRSFDLIISLDVLSHLRRGDDRKALEEFARVLRPGGNLLIRVPAFHALRSRHSQFIAETHRYRSPELRGMLANIGLNVLESTYANAFLSPVAFIKFRILEYLSKAPASSGVEEIPASWLNALLDGMLKLEASLIRMGARFPFGQSLLVAARKPVETAARA
jgi:SAM-dependent methyltransferase